MAQLRVSCESLPEEQLAKLGVVLFNCQAEVEGRQTYPCTQEMVNVQTTAEAVLHNTSDVTYICVTDLKGLHKRHGPGHVERLPHSEQPSTFCLLRSSPAALSPPSGTDGQRFDIHSQQPAGRNEGPEGRVGMSSIFTWSDRDATLCEFTLTGGPVGAKGTDCGLIGQAAGGTQCSAGPTGNTP